MRDLEELFPVTPVPQGALTDSYGDAFTITDRFRGLCWNDVPPILLRSQYEAPVFFSPEAYQYYFPAYIINEENYYDDIDLALDYLMLALTSSDEPVLSAWRMRRINIFSKKQLEVIHQWLEKMKADNRPVDHLEEAIIQTAQALHW